MEDLKPCPFCGGSKIYRTYIGCSDWDFDCADCGASTCFTVKIDEQGEAETRAANDKWNVRAAEDCLRHDNDKIRAYAKELEGVISQYQLDVAALKAELDLYGEG